MKKAKIIQNIVIVVFCIAANVLLRMSADVFQLPVWLDTLGTALATYQLGMAGSLVVSLGSNAILCAVGIIQPMDILLGIIVGVYLGIFARKRFVDSISKSVIASFWLSIFCIFTYTAWDTFFNGGYTGNIWGDALIDMMLWDDYYGILSTAAGETIVHMLDKQLCVVFAVLIVRLIKKIKSENIKKKELAKSIAVIAAAGIASAYMLPPIKAEASDKEFLKDNFASVIYNKTSGMVCSEANAIGETDDGFIWIGSYAGLTRYDGTNFSFIREGGIVSVLCMMTDSHGRLWIGSNDAGIAIYDDGEFLFYTADDGVAANSVRCFAEAPDGSVYIGTTGRVCRMSPDMTIEELSYDINYITDIAIYNNIPIALDHEGKLFLLSDTAKDISESVANNEFFNCIEITSRGIAAGTSSGKVVLFGLDGEEVSVKKTIDLPDTKITALYEDSQSRMWIGADMNLGYLDTEYGFHRIYNSEFDTSFNCIHEDYQGNIWITSSRFGVLKLSESRFVDIFEKAGIDDYVINAVEYYNNDFYCATDSGIISLSGTTLQPRTNNLTKITDSNRVRCVFRDSKNRLWICTYSDQGLICYDDRNGVTYYNTETAAVTSNRFRCVTELSDGAIVAGSTNGLNIIRDNKLVKTVSNDDGLANSQILSIVEHYDGNILVGTDGAGIYLLDKDGNILDNYTRKDGLSSDVVMRLVPYNDSYFIVASNALCFMNSSGAIRRISNFPYFDNYDVIIKGETAYVLSSTGVYAAAVSDLCEDKQVQYKLYGVEDGLLAGLTSNSWNYVYSDGTLYLCSNSGVIVFLDTEDKVTLDNLKYGIVSVEGNGDKLEPADGSNRYRIPKNTKQLTIHSSVRNYSLADVNLRIFTDDSPSHQKVFSWSEVEPYQIMLGDSSECTVHLQIVDLGSDEVISEKTYTFYRDMQMWEHPWYRAFLVIAGIEILVFFILSISLMIFAAKRKNELEMLQKELEEKVELQTEEIRNQQKKTEWLYDQTVRALADAVDAKDRYTSGHSTRVAKYSKMIAERMGKDETEQLEIYRAGLLHDVGKIRVPIEIINKPGKLTDDEYDVIKIHPLIGFHILKRISASGYISIGAKYHHERYDGRGYPSGLAGDNIPEVARILGVADAYDAMASNRSYRNALPQEVVRSEIEKGKGTQFDPDIADIMLRMIDEDKQYDMKQNLPPRRVILVVDDDIINYRLVSNIMKNNEYYDVIYAGSGAKALALLDNTKIDMVLLDLLMPEMDGFETVVKIKEKSEIPVVLMTGDRTSEIIQKAIELGCVDYITKPFQPMQIQEIIHSVINDH